MSDINETPLFEFIVEAIKKQGPMAFSELMQLALYHPLYGYYSSQDWQIGRAGDFVTAPELSPLFGYCLAQQMAGIFKQLKTPSILEFGAGSGKLALSILTYLEALNLLPECYYILEPSYALRAKQRALLEKALPHLTDKIVFLERLPQTPFEGVIIANEVLDAMPVTRFLLDGGNYFELAVDLNEKNQLVDKWVLKSKPCMEFINELGPYDRPYQSEVNCHVKPWLKSIHSILKKGVVLLLDYGFPKAEYYHPDRYMGTLMCHYRHKSQTDPYLYLGNQDITAHVDFTLVAESALAQGFNVLGYTTQAFFLLANDLLAIAEAKMTDSVSRLEFNQQIKMLTMPSEMGELFKVIALGKGFDAPLAGFLLRDNRDRL